MSFPLDDYIGVFNESMAIITDRDAKGRNAAYDFYAGFPHGHSDVSFELSRRVGRILGAEMTGHTGVAREDALDLLNYAAFYVMLLDREASAPVVPSMASAPVDRGGIVISTPVTRTGSLPLDAVLGGGVTGYPKGQGETRSK